MIKNTLGEVKSKVYKDSQIGGQQFQIVGEDLTEKVTFNKRKIRVR